MRKIPFSCTLGLFALCAAPAAVAVPLVAEYVSPVSIVDGHRYVIYSAGDFDNPIRWSDARDAAVGVDGYLATITDAPEEQFVQDAFAGSRIGVGVTAWIGLSDAAQENDFQWVTGPDAGTTLTYSDWRTGEPNNNGVTGNEDYVTWENYPLGPAGGAWNDAYSEERVFRFMVEFQPAAVPEPPVLGLLCAGLIALSLLAKTPSRGHSTL